jgi:AraC family transcriptional regulator, transcriptional activator of pobA
MTSVRVSSTFYETGTPHRRVALSRIDLRTTPWEPPRTNCFTVCHIQQGQGRFWADAGHHAYSSRELLFFVPYQHIRFEPAQKTTGNLIRFHANFLCVETFHAETGCSGVLFNDPYGSPVVDLDRSTAARIRAMIADLQQEVGSPKLASDEAALAYLKLLLIAASRRKTTLCAARSFRRGVRHPLIEPLTQLIEENYRTLHSPAEYAAKLHTTPKTLGRIVKDQLGKTLTDLIRERILTHAKWQLLHTLRPVKEIAHEVGFEDELYFSRFFKKATSVSPLFFREFETEIRGGSNLSMSSSLAPIPSNGHTPDDVTRRKRSGTRTQ